MKRYERREDGVYEITRAVGKDFFGNSAWMLDGERKLSNREAKKLKYRA